MIHAFIGGFGVGIFVGALMALVWLALAESKRERSRAIKLARECWRREASNV
jgi:putative copper export protein